jgi:hypothetical protein
MAYRRRAQANKIQTGIVEAISGIVVGFVLITVVNSFAQDGMLPKYFVWVFGLLSFVANIASLNRLRVAGLWYSIGWLAGSWLVISLLSPLDIAFNIAGPIVVIGLRTWFWVKSKSSG